MVAVAKIVGSDHSLYSTRNSSPLVGEPNSSGEADFRVGCVLWTESCSTWVKNTGLCSHATP